VGDLVVLNAGDRVPADGIFITGSDVSCNESSLTGEPDDLDKGPHNGGTLPKPIAFWVTRINYDVQMCFYYLVQPCLRVTAICW